MTEATGGKKGGKRILMVNHFLETLRKGSCFYGINIKEKTFDDLKEKPFKIIICEEDDVTNTVCKIYSIEDLTKRKELKTFEGTREEVEEQIKDFLLK